MVSGGWIYPGTTFLLRSLDELVTVLVFTTGWLTGFPNPWLPSFVSFGQLGIPRSSNRSPNLKKEMFAKNPSPNFEVRTGFD